MRTAIVATLVVMAACGDDGTSSAPDAAAPDAPPDIASVAIAAAACTATSTTMTLDTTMAVHLALGQAFRVDGGDVNVATGATLAQRTSYQCGAWSHVMLGNLDDGCQRMAGQPATQAIMATVRLTGATGTFPDPTIVAVGGLVEQTPFSGDYVAMIYSTITCN